MVMSNDVERAFEVCAAADVATYQTFDGQVIEFAGRREGEKAYVTIQARRDPALAAKDSPAPPAAAAPAPAATPPAPPATPTASPTAAKPADQTLEKLGTRTKGMEFEIPVYKYEAIFRKQEELLEKLPEPVKATTHKK